MWNLVTGGNYKFRVKAENKYGISEACETEEVQIKDPSALPGPPEKVTIAERSKTYMVLTWEPPKDSGGSMITGYWLEKREKGTSYWSRVNKILVSKRGIKGWEYQVTRLFEGVEYEFRAMACNSAGIGPPSAISESAVADDPLSKTIFKCISILYRIYYFIFLHHVLCLCVQLHLACLQLLRLLTKPSIVSPLHGPHQLKMVAAPSRVTLLRFKMKALLSGPGSMMLKIYILPLCSPFQTSQNSRNTDSESLQSMKLGSLSLVPEPLKFA